MIEKFSNYSKLKVLVALEGREEKEEEEEEKEEKEEERKMRRFVKHEAHRSPSSNLLGEHAFYAGIAHHSRLNDSGSNNKGFGLIPQN
ncbi:hypothetical protein M8J76_002956 [Diaphorina citri]|nr:hypothetical protein M8J76_002956 [Diaphorina citri]